MKSTARVARLGAVALASAISSVQAGSLSCGRGGPKAERDYAYAVALLQTGRRLTEIQETDVIRRLTDAVENDCRHAALVLLEIRALQRAVVRPGTPHDVADARDNEIFELLQAATRLDEGWYEFGAFYLEGDTHYYSPEKAVEMFERAAAQGDRRAVEELAGAYERGTGGIAIDPERAAAWRHRLEVMSR